MDGTEVRAGGSATGTAASKVPFSRLAFVTVAGAAIEWYDFFIYATASAIVFGQLFFPDKAPLTGTLLAFSTFAVGFMARPLGGIIFGHLGDRLGRKRAIVIALVMMGIATTLIGTLPTAATVGVLAPILLVSLRIVQGLALGGQWGGLVLLATENAPANRRGFYGSLPTVGIPVGVILANGIFLVSTAVLSDAQFLAWGWRVPFLLSIILVGMGLYVQLRIEETRSFQKVEARHTEARHPITSAIRQYPKEVLLGGGTMLGCSAVWYVLFIFTLSYGTKALGLSNSMMLTGVLIAMVFGIFVIMGWAALSDRIGRRKVFMAGAVLTALWAFPFYWLLNTKEMILIVLALVVGQVVQAMMHGPSSTLYSELFGTRVRYSGASLAYQLGSLFGGAFAPIIATALLAATGTSLSLTVYLIVLCLISLVSIVLLSETYRVDMDRLEKGQEV